MKCPACSTQLSHLDVNGVEVDVCKGGCGGVWFDTHEFKKFDEPFELTGESLLEIETDPDIEVDRSKRNCPRCDNITMMRRFFSTKREVEIDECGSCAGVWLDTGELAHLRSLFDSEEDKKAAAKEIFADLFGPQLEGLVKEREESKKNARRLANMFKFICPSYYLSDQQDWGAF